MELEHVCNIDLILRSLFDLNKSQIQLFSLILSNQYACTHFLEFKTDLKNNAIQKNLMKLMNEGLIQRQAVTLSEFKSLCQQREDEHFSLPSDIASEKGYLYLYKTKPTEELTLLFESKMKEIEQNLTLFKQTEWEGIDNE